MSEPLDTSARRMLEDLPLLRFLTPDARALCVNAFVPASYSFGNVIVREGDPADALFVLAAGKARVVKTGTTGEEISEWYRRGRK